MFTVKSAGAKCEVNTEMNLPLRVSVQYFTIGDETRPSQIQINLFETKEARFVMEENITNGRNS